MINDNNIMEVVRLISDWAKWLITIETTVIALIGSLSKSLPRVGAVRSDYVGEVKKA